MTKFSAAVIFAALAVPAQSIADDQAFGSAPKPASLVPHARSTGHVYGSPISRPIVGRAANHRHNQALKRQLRR